MTAASSAGHASPAVSEVLAQTVLAGHFPGIQQPAAAHYLDGLGGAREGQPGSYGGDFQGAPLRAAVAPWRRSRAWSATGTGARAGR
jgi:hypothetical protein